MASTSPQFHTCRPSARQLKRYVGASVTLPGHRSTNMEHSVVVLLPQAHCVVTVAIMPWKAAERLVGHCHCPETGGTNFFFFFVVSLALEEREMPSCLPTCFHWYMAPAQFHSTSTMAWLEIHAWTDGRCPLLDEGGFTRRGRRIWEAAKWPFLPILVSIPLLAGRWPAHSLPIYRG